MYICHFLDTQNSLIGLLMTPYIMPDHKIKINHSTLVRFTPADVSKLLYTFIMLSSLLFS